MKVKIIKPYLDTARDNVLTLVGTELDVAEDRGNVLIKAGVAEEISAAKPEKEEKAVKTERKTKK